MTTGSDKHTEIACQIQWPVKLPSGLKQQAYFFSCYRTTIWGSWFSRTSKIHHSSLLGQRIPKVPPDHRCHRPANLLCQQKSNCGQADTECIPKCFWRKRENRVPPDKCTTSTLVGRLLPRRVLHAYSSNPKAIRRVGHSLNLHTLKSTRFWTHSPPRKQWGSESIARHVDEKNLIRWIPPSIRLQISPSPKDLTAEIWISTARCSGFLGTGAVVNDVKMM